MTSLRSAGDWSAGLMAPASDAKLSAALAVMAVGVAARDLGKEATDLQHAAYVQAMRAYPADVALAAIRDWSGKFWPTLSELHEACTRLQRDRTDILAALRYEQARLAREGSQ